ncbi:MAG: tRNA (guanosine(37)-N1)-methyltransferase TrmD [Verrucomicrobiota bacterium]
MRIDVLTLFPEILGGALPHSILGRASREKKVEFHLHQLRDYALDKHRIVDDRPYGGGPGMVLKCEPLVRAIEAIQSLGERAHVIFMSPGGRKFDQKIAQEFSERRRLLILCGHYEGIDQRVIEGWVDEEISIGDYVLSNGAVAALAVIDATVRLLPGVLGNEESAGDDSFSQGQLEGPQYTRPEEFQGRKVPEILLGGDHGKIREWRLAQGREKTKLRRPDLG